MKSAKSKGIATILALFFGGFGVHWFYLDNAKRGVLYLVFCWTLIPTFLAIIDFFTLAFMEEGKFDAKYNA